RITGRLTGTAARSRMSLHAGGEAVSRKRRARSTTSMAPELLAGSGGPVRETRGTTPAMAFPPPTTNRAQPWIGAGSSVITGNGTPAGAALIGDLRVTSRRALAMPGAGARRRAREASRNAVLAQSDSGKSWRMAVGPFRARGASTEA